MASSERDTRLSKYQSKPFGGDGGAPWDDVRGASSAIVGIYQINIRHGNQVDAIQVTYRLADGSTYLAPAHGGSGGKPSSFTLAEDEKIVRVVCKTNNVLVDQVKFVTKNGVGEKHTYGPFGKTGETSVVELEGDVIGFFGRSGDLLDALGVYYYPPEKDISVDIRNRSIPITPINNNRFQRWSVIIVFSLIVAIIASLYYVLNQM